MDAVVLVGGQGTRLRPLTITTPKPMLPTAGVPFLTHLLLRAREAGVDHAILSTSYQAHVFEGHFGDGSALGLRITYVTEDEPLGTGGAIRNAASVLTGGDFLVFNGDVLSGLPLPDLIKTHADSGADVTLYLTEVDDPRAFGLVPLDEHGRVTAFLEKPQTPEEIVTNRINAGCYVMAPSVLGRIPAGRPVSVERETFPALLRDGVRVMGHVDTSYWLDVGTPAAFVRGCVDLVTGRVSSPALSSPPGDALVLPGAHVDATAVVRGGSVVGAGSHVSGDALVEAAVLFDDVVVGPHATVRRSVVGRGARLGAGVTVEDAVIGDGARIEPGNELRAGARVWPGVTLAETSVRFSPDR